MSTSSVLSADSQTTSSSRLSRDSKSSAEGRSQSHWKLFRKEVLASHHIRILDTVDTDQLPDAVVGWVNANRDNVSRFSRQRKHFRKQVALGRGFGDSALFPHEVLPWTRGQPFIAKCMVPTYSSASLPQRMVPDPTGRLCLTPPRPGFACGFSSAAFGPEELRSIPEFLVTSGTTLQFETGCVTPDSALYCPFMTFERAFHQQKYGLEIAANQCAVDGAWCVRSLQMLQQKANSDSKESAFEDPVSFTCAIDNNIAIIYYHWVDHAQTYCMAPVVRFELSRDDHFNQFLVWIEAVGQWAVSYILPEIKKAICLITENFSEELALIKPIKTSQNTTEQVDQRLVSALRLSYENIPWRLDGEDSSAASSSTASWGSPVVNETVFSRIRHPIRMAPSFTMPMQIQTQPKSHTQMQMPVHARTPPLPGNVCSEPMISKSVRFADLPPSRERGGLKLRPALDMSLAPWSKPAVPEPPLTNAEPLTKATFDMNSDLVMSRRLNHAMDEIKTLQQQMMNMKQEFTGSTMCLQNELSGLRKSMTTVLRKERLSFKQGPSMRGNLQDATNGLLSEKRSVNFEKEVSVITTPTDPTARPIWPRGNSGGTILRRSSGLQNMLTLDTKVSTSVTTTTTITSACERSANGVESHSPGSITIYSPTIINVNSAVDGNMNDDKDELDRENYGALIRIPRTRHNNWSPVLASHVLCSLVPSAMLRVIFLGLVLDYCMVSIGSTHAQSFSHYISNVLESAITV